MDRMKQCVPCGVAMLVTAQGTMNLTRVLVPDHQLYTQRVNVADTQIQHVTTQTPGCHFRHTSGGLKSINYQTPISNSFGKKRTQSQNVYYFPVTGALQRLSILFFPGAEVHISIPIVQMRKLTAEAT